MTDFSDDIEKCLTVLRSGGLILYPTDTVWGIGCDATNEQAVEKIYQLKQRPGTKAMIILVAEERDVLQHVAAPDLQVFDYLETTTKPTTVIYEGAIGLAGNLLAEDGSIAIRICKDEFCRHLIKRFRKPLVSTSANISGDVPPASFAGINEKIKNGVEYIVLHKQNEENTAQPSSVIKWENGKVSIIRP